MRGGPAIVRVLFVHTATLPPLGADTWVQAQIVAGLDKSTHEVHVACNPGPIDHPTPTFAAMRDIPGIEILPTNLGPELSHHSAVGRLRTLLRTLPAIVHVAMLAWYVRRRRIDVIHTTDRPRDALVSVLLARITRTPCIVHLHVGFDPDWMGKVLQWSIRRADALVAISDFVASTLDAAGRVHGDVYVVKNAIDASAWNPHLDGEQARAEFGFAPDDVVVITVCRLFPAKGTAELIRALAIVREKWPDVRLLVVGQEVTPGYEAHLVRLVAEFDLTDSVVFAGRRSDVASLMASADVFAMPSHLEPFGLVYLEAMAMGLPVVALEDGGTPEVVEAGLSGLLSPYGDTEAFANNLLLLAGDAPLRERIGNNGRERVLTSFGVCRMAEDMAVTYRLIVSNPQ